MTGQQEHPATGYTIRGAKAHQIDFIELGVALGIENPRKLNPWNLEETEQVIKEELEKDEPSLVVSEGPCALLRRAFKKYYKPLFVDSTKCIGCKACVNLGCPAISYQTVEGEMAVTADGKKRKGISHIEATLVPDAISAIRFVNLKPLRRKKKSLYSVLKPIKIFTGGDNGPNDHEYTAMVELLTSPSRLTIPGNSG